MPDGSIMDTHSRSFDQRDSGLPMVGDLPWGSHFCVVYENEEVLLEVLVPFLESGLKGNEQCLWVAPDAASTEAAAAMVANVPGLAGFSQSGQLTIIAAQEYDQTPEAVLARLEAAVARGRDGLRVAAQCAAGSPEPFECSIHNTPGDPNMIVACLYPCSGLDALRMTDVIKRHGFALLGKADGWEVIKSSAAAMVRDALKRSEAKLQSLFGSMSEGFAYHRIVLDDREEPCDYIFLEVNDAFERQTGLRGKDIIGRKVTAVLPGIESDPTDWIGRYGRVALTGQPTQFESYSKSLDRWYAVSAFSPHKGFFAATFTDITERKRAELALKEREEELATIYEKAPLLMLLVDEERRVRRANRSVLDLAGVSADLLNGMRTGEALGCLNSREDLRGCGFGPRCQSCPMKLAIARIFEHGASTNQVEVDRSLLIDGRQLDVTLLLSAAPVRVQGEPLALLTLQDISDRKQANVALKEAMAKLERSNAELQQFAYIASHDLQEPLRTVASFLQLLWKRYAKDLDEDAREFIDYAVDGAHRMQAMISDLLAFSRVGSKEDDFVEVEMQQALDRALSNLKLVLEESGAMISQGELPTVTGDASMMILLLQNLISNGVKFRGEDPPHIHIDARHEDGHWLFSVRDNGIGMNPKYADRIFVIFQRLHRRTEYQGTGIGLAICKRIVERHRGRIWVESAPGDGSTFWFTLPS